MSLVVLDPDAAKQYRLQREQEPGSQYDEVWDGVYVAMPLPNDEHQEIVLELGSIFLEVIKRRGLGDVRPGINLSDRGEDWKQNYREPDVVVFLRETTARNLGTHWVGGPDFVVEIVSPGDWTRKKLPFYESVGTRELLLIDRQPWALELYGLRDGKLGLVGKSTPDDPAILPSAILPLTFRLVAGEGRPRIEIERRDGGGRWTI